MRYQSQDNLLKRHPNLKILFISCINVLDGQLIDQHLYQTLSWKLGVNSFNGRRPYNLYNEERLTIVILYSLISNSMIFSYIHLLILECMNCTIAAELVHTFTRNTYNINKLQTPGLAVLPARKC